MTKLCAQYPLSSLGDDANCHLTLYSIFNLLGIYVVGGKLLYSLRGIARYEAEE